MRKIVLLLVLFSIGAIAFSQEITVRFTGQLNGTDYCRLDRVVVTNLTRNWSETLEYPDTIIVLGGTVGTDLNIAATQGLGQNIPNPFDCETRVELSVSQRENVRMQLLDVSGKQYAEYSGSLDAGVHTFDISAAAPQTYVLNATVGSRSYSIRMVNMGSGCGSSIKYAGISGSITAKLTSANEFHNGDNMRYVGYTTIGGQMVASAVIEQAQVVSQYVTLNFTHYSRPTVGTLAATNITITSATLRGTITDDGGAAVTSRGFYYGTDADNLSQMVSAGSGNGEYSKVLSGLTVATTYYYCAFATNSAGTAIGEVMSFSSLEIVPPTVQTNAASSISTTDATLSGNVTADGGATVTTRGFVYGTSTSNLSQNVQSGTGTGNFTKALTGLSRSTTYYYKAYATNSAGTSYGEVRTFTTLAISLPTITTDSASSITTAGAILSGNVTSDGSATVTARGFVYGTSANNLSHTVQSGSGIGSFTANITGLISGTTYYYKAFAINSAGTAYGNVMSFTSKCACGGSVKVTDIDGNQYATVLIGEQCWMAENLRTTKFANGANIYLGSSGTTSSTTAFRYYPNQSSSNESTYGYLYNWRAAMHGASGSEVNPSGVSGVQGVCPDGWHLPSNAEWTQLTNYLSSQSQYQCGSTSTKIAKSLASKTGWNSSTTTCAVGNNPTNNNSTGFGALPAGNYFGSGYRELGLYAMFWSATQRGSDDSSQAYIYYFRYDWTYVNNSEYRDRGYGMSVRCVRD